jgi:hypothetical protein
MAPPSSRAELREENACIVLVQTGGVCEDVHITKDTLVLEMKYGGYWSE